jgi:hypothetical protein
MKLTFRSKNMTTTVHEFVKGKLPVITVSKDDSLAGRIRTRAA